MDDLRRAIAFLDQVRAAPDDEKAGTGALRDAREWIESAARALVAASPCAAQPQEKRCPWPDCPHGSECVHAAAQGGQQPEPDNCVLCLGAKGGVRGNENLIGGLPVCDHCSSALNSMGLTGAAPVPAAPLTHQRLVEIELSLRKYTDGDRYDLSLMEFARAIEAAHGITLAGTTGTKKESADGR